MSGALPVKSSTPADGLSGPDELANAVLGARATADWEANSFGDISDEAVRELIRLAYFAGQSPNEGRYPRLRLLVPKKDVPVRLDVPLQNRLTRGFIQRIAPAVDYQNHALVVRANHGLECVGITTTEGAITDLNFGEPLFPYLDRPAGLLVELVAPGELRAGEHRVHRVQSGRLSQEMSFCFEPWFLRWCLTASELLFESEQKADSRNHIPRLAVSAFWVKLLKLAEGLRHGSCFALLPDRSPEPCGVRLRPAFRSSGLDLGAALVEFVAPQLRDWRFSGRPVLGVTADEVRSRVWAKHSLLSAVHTLARLSATDGCVVLNQRLQLQSFGTMIEPTDDTEVQVSVFQGDSTEPLSDEHFRSFGARRSSALALCRAIPESLVFVISQDGDLRAFAHRDGAVRLYDHLAYW